MKKALLGVLLAVGLMLSGCGSGSKASQKESKDLNKKLQQTTSQNKTDADSLRQKAKVAGSASRVVGYDGNRIDRDLNKIIDKSEDLKSQYKEFGLD